jgi:preprotein translocase subunit SecD
MLTRRVFLLAAVGALASCGSSSKQHVFHLRPDSALPGAALDRSATIFQKRLDAIGLGGTAARSGDEVVVRFPSKTLPPYLPAKSTLELYDLEEAMVAGPSDSLPAARSGTVTVSCSATQPACPQVLAPGRTYYYLFKTPPALTGADIKGGATFLDKDPTGHPIVVLAFTRVGARKFSEVTRIEARRGRNRGAQHLAVVFDRQIVSYPSIDPRLYPNGLSGSNGVEITGGTSLDEASAIADVLRAGTLPVPFHVVRRTAR